MDFVNIFISFSGRINRAKYWIAVVCCGVFFLAVIGVTAALSSSMSTVFSSALIAYIPLTYVGVVSGIKRLHDRNKSGWWILLLYGGPMLLPLIGIGLSGAAGASLPLAILQLASFIIWIWAFVELGCLRGTIGQNQYGPDPLAPEVLTPPVRTHA
jgi:uncharacterized membrane protein YhaH (DUF805 family)